ncbi:Divergent AAA region [Shewanella denitrificans OS217]|uniref:Divergent AAA region n=1 Tax=Shewanella denitrificans (strain OS217 / ATCC BAA-1090 / DSM 15013) TaxID=318161 RepID=Q12IU1_SHEDO|nr:ATP-binding protein [Shewanella denitrificans]ABE56635.1 Divergent AAA region [Shewanella denitrificans OS217]
MASFETESARRFLTEFEQILSNPKLHFFYCEWKLLLAIRERRFMWAAISENVHQYPHFYKAYLAIKGSIVLPYDKLFPVSLQNWINDASRLCLNVLLDGSKANIDALIMHIDSGGHYEECVPNYYKLCVKGFRKVSNICSKYPLGSQEIKDVVDNAASIFATGGHSDASRLNKILSINIDKYGSNAIKILHLVQEKEGKQLEFKSSFNYDVNNDERSKVLKYQCTKTISAFLNSKGGTLLVGVDDNGKILGLEKDLSYVGYNQDKFVLKFKDTVKAALGAKISNLVEWSLEEVGRNLFVLIVEVKPSPFPVLHNEKEFFIRFNPSSDRILDNKDYQRYVQTRFKDLSA